MSYSVLPMFSSKGFIVSGLTFRSLNHFFSLCMVLEVSHFILFNVAVQCSQHHLLKKLSFPHCIFLLPLSKIRCVGVSRAFYLVPHLYFCLCTSTILSWWLWLCGIVWSQEGWLLQLHSSSSRLLWLFRVFCVSIWIVKFFVLVLWKMTLIIW